MQDEGICALCLGAREGLWKVAEVRTDSIGHAELFQAWRTAADRGPALAVAGGADQLRDQGHADRVDPFHPFQADVRDAHCIPRIQAQTRHGVG